MRFSPNWWEFCAVAEDAYQQAASPAEQAAFENAILSGYSERGWHVLNQSRDLDTIVADPNHKIVRWRLLMPWLGHVLHLPGWATLGLAHLGCLLWLAYLAAILRARGISSMETLLLVLVLGASAPFFASMGLLGYFDSWLVLGLLAVAHSPRHWLVLLACVLTPWVDERFVLGLPLALLVRWILAGRPTSAVWPWARDEALGPVMLTAVYVMIRLSLGGQSGSQTVGEYLRQFVFNQEIALGQQLSGAWSGLRFGWLLIAVGVVTLWQRRWLGWLLAIGTLVTCVIGLVTALDLSRSMALLLPPASLGAVLVARATGRRSWLWAWPAALLAVAIPAKHVFGPLSLPVDNWGTPSLPLLTAHNNLAVLLSAMPGRQPEAVAHLAEALRLKPDHVDAHNNLAVLLAAMPNRQPEAVAHYTEALRLKPDHVEAHYNLANLLAAMPNRQQEAVKHYTEALRLKPDCVEAHNNLAILLAAIPGCQPEAIIHYTEALRLKPDNVEAHNNLAILLAAIPGREPEAAAHYEEALRLKPDYGVSHFNLAVLLAATPGREQEALVHYEASARLLPGNAVVHFHFARMLEKLAVRKSEAEAHYQKAISLDPSFSSARESLDRWRNSRD